MRWLLRNSVGKLSKCVSPNDRGNSFGEHHYDCSASGSNRSSVLSSSLAGWFTIKCCVTPPVCQARLVLADHTDWHLPGRRRHFECWGDTAGYRCRRDSRCGKQLVVLTVWRDSAAEINLDQLDSLMCHTWQRYAYNGQRLQNIKWSKFRVRISVRGRERAEQMCLSMSAHAQWLLLVLYFSESSYSVTH